MSAVNTDCLHLTNHDAPLMMANGWDDSTFRNLNADERKKVLQLYQEAKVPAQRVLELYKERDRMIGVVAAVRCELEDLSDDAQLIDEGQTHLDWVGYHKQHDAMQKDLEQGQTEVDDKVAEIDAHEALLRELAERCATLLSNPFAHAVYGALPAELRNQVYDHLWDWETVETIDHHVTRAKERNDERTSGNWILSAPFFADAKIVGELFAREAATQFFRMITDAEVHYRLVRVYVQMNQFGNMSFRPRDIIRRLRIDVQWSNSWGREEIVYADLQDNLQSLLCLPARNDFVVEIFLPRQMQFSRIFFHVLDIIKPIYHSLVQKGVKIKVLGYRFFTPSWRVDTADTTETGPKFHCTTAEALNFYFDGTTEDWFAMKEAELAAIKNPRRMQKCFDVLDIMRENFKDMGVLAWVGNSQTITWPDQPTLRYNTPAGLFEPVMGMYGMST